MHDPLQRVVRLVTGILKHLVVAPRPRILAGERRRPDRRVLDGEGVDQLVGALHPEAFGHLHVPGAPGECRAITEIGRLDDQGVAVPPANRITQPFLDLGRVVLGVHPDDPGVVHHLDENHHRILALHDPLVVVVERRHHRRARRRAEREQAALGEGALLHVVIRARGIQTGFQPVRGAVVCPSRAPAPARGLDPRRIPTVGRVDQNRRAPLSIDLECALAGVDPEGVVPADVPGRARRPVTTLRRRAAVGVARSISESHRLPRALGELGRLFIGQRHLLAQLGPSLHGGQCRHVVRARQVGTTARCPANVAVLRRGHRRERQTHQCQPTETERDSTAHVNLLDFAWQMKPPL